MLRSQEDLKYYLEADRLALGGQWHRPFTRLWLANLMFPHEIWRFEILLRKLEYLHNRKRTLGVNIRKVLLNRKYLQASRELGFSIPVNVFGPGLNIAHCGTIVVNSAAKVGSNCRIHVCVNIGTEAGHSDKAPRIGHNVYIGPGAKIFGEITIADGCAIGANAVVNKSFLEPNSVIAGVPARKIGEVDTNQILVRATEVLKARGWDYKG